MVLAADDQSSGDPARGGGQGGVGVAPAHPLAWLQGQIGGAGVGDGQGCGQGLVLDNRLGSRRAGLAEEP